MRRWLILIASHLVVLAMGFAGGIYVLPILTAPKGPDAAALQATTVDALYTGRFVRSLKGSDFLHWGETVQPFFRFKNYSSISPVRPNLRNTNQ